VGDCVYVLKSGIVKELVAADDGKSIVVRLVTAGGVSGLEALAGLPYRHSAIVLHPGAACRIPVAVIKRYELASPDAAKQMRQAWQQAVEDSERVLLMTHGAAQLRIARLLQFLRETVPPGESIRIRRADIADLLGVTEVSVARALAEFRKRGLIGQRGRSISHIDPQIALLAAKHPTAAGGALPTGSLH
jgi:CRP/FNR family transcriptional regulator